MNQVEEIFIYSQIESDKAMCFAKIVTIQTASAASSQTNTCSRDFHRAAVDE